jgi:isoquinoline 1-oxidoreductase subunit alpha
MQTIVVNGVPREIGSAPGMPLLWVLRDVLGLTGTKYGCGLGQCGACTVHLDGAAVRSCLTPVGSVGARKITTIEGVAAEPRWARLVAAWIQADVPQCGYCQPGQIMSASALLTRAANPSDADLNQEMAGNLCRCGTYLRIRSAIRSAATERPR